MADQPVKKLYRSTKDRWIAGVCGGIGEYLAVDPIIIRLLWILFGLTGTGILIYILAWLIIPEPPEETTPPPEAKWT